MRIRATLILSWLDYLKQSPFQSFGTLVDVEYGDVPDGHAQTVLDKVKVL